MKRGMYLVTLVGLFAGCSGDGYTSFPSLRTIEEQLQKPKVYNVSCDYQKTYKHLLTSMQAPQSRVYMTGICEHEIWTDTQEARICVLRDSRQVVAFHFAIKATGESTCTVAVCTCGRNRANVAQKWIEALNSSSQ